MESPEGMAMTEAVPAAKDFSHRGAYETFLLAACARLGYDSTLIELLLLAARETRAEIPLIRDDGSLSVFNGYRVQHHDARDPTKEGCDTTRASTWTRYGGWPVS
jgi:glutamate dehydrogenase (NAD(P)+)